jgi:membrane protease YdiL (CAAX protease family)
VKHFITRRPYSFSLLIYVSLWALAFGCRLALPSLSLQQRAEAFQLLAALLAAGLLAITGRKDAGFTRPRDLRVFWCPVLFLIVAPMLGGIYLPPVEELVVLALGVAVTAFSEEVIFRGVVWRALLPTGVMGTVFLTALLFGTLHLAKIAIGGSLEEVLPILVATTLGGVGYAALRLRTDSIWPIMLFHAAFNFTNGITKPETVPGLIPLLTFAVTLGFLGYGLFLLRDSWLPGSGSGVHGVQRVR